MSALVVEPASAPEEERATYLPRITVLSIKRAVALAAHVTPEDINGPRRHKSVALARHVAMWCCRELMGLSYPEIGSYFGGRDHTTAMAAVRRIGGLQTNDHRARAVVRSSLELLGVRFSAGGGP